MQRAGTWKNWSSRAHRAGWMLLLLAGLSTGFSAAPAMAASAQPGRIAVAAPAGFDSLTGPQKVVVDIYFGDRRLGEASITYQPGSLRFDNPDAVLALLPQLGDPASVRAALAAGDLASNASRVCTPGSDPQQCGRIAPQVAGIIFDEQRFRVDIFVNPRLLHIEQAVRIDYLPRPQAGAALVNSLSAVVSGSTRGGNNCNLQNRLLLGESDKRLRADIAYSSGFGAQADQIVAEIDRPGWRFSGGAFWTPGSSLIGRRRIVGVGAATQFDTRLDKDEMRGNPLIVFLGQRAKVDILRDGRVIASRVYEGGSQALDTSGLPDGAYEVVLQITETGGAVREERRFFTRNRQIAPVGHAIYFAYAGVLMDDFSRKFLSPTRTPFAQAGGGWRLNPHVALDANVLATNKTVIGEVGATWIGRAAQFRLGGVLSSNGTRGGFLHASSSGNSRLNFDFDLRHIRVRDRNLGDGGQHEEPLPLLDDGLVDRNLAGLPIARRTYTQLAGSLNLSLRGGQIGISGAWRKERGQPASYNAGPWIRWDLLNRGPWNLSFRVDYSRSQEGNAGYVGLSLRFQGGRTAVVGDAGFRRTRARGEPTRNGPIGSLTASWSRDKPGGTDIELAAGYDRDLDNQLVNGHLAVRTMQAQLGGDIIYSPSGANRGDTQYSLGFLTTMALRSGKLSFVGKAPNDSMVMVKVDGREKGGRFEVLVNDMPEGSVRSGGSLAVALTPYRQYNVRIRPIGAGLLHYDGSARRIGLYPGNVARLDWTVRRLVAMFGQLRFPDGSPVANANIHGDGGIGQSDGQGLFQIEAADGAEMTVVLADGRSCKVQPPATNNGEQFVKLEAMTCNPNYSGKPFNTALRP